MGFKLLILNPTDSLVDRRTLDRWPDKLKKAIPDIEVTICHSDRRGYGGHLRTPTPPSETSPPSSLSGQIV